MAVPKGFPKPPGSGRKKGVLNKRTQFRLESVDQVLERMNVNPFAVLAELANDADKGIRLQASKELAQYVAPKKRDVQIQSQNQTELTAKIDQTILADFDKIIEARLSERRTQGSSS